jgi:hypothetical protein
MVFGFLPWEKTDNYKVLNQFIHAGLKFRIKESNNLYANNIGIDADIYQISKEVSEQNKDKFVLNLMIFFADAI